MGDARVRRGVLLAEHHVAGLDRQDACLGHGVARIDGQIQNHLLDLRRIDLDRPEARGFVPSEIDVLADQAAQHALDVLDHLVQVDQLGRNDVTTRESQELPSEPGRALARLERDGELDVLARARALIERLDRK